MRLQLVRWEQCIDVSSACGVMISAGASDFAGRWLGLDSGRAAGPSDQTAPRHSARHHGRPACGRERRPPLSRGEVLHHIHRVTAHAHAHMLWRADRSFHDPVGARRSSRQTQHVGRWAPAIGPIYGLRAFAVLDIGRPLGPQICRDQLPTEMMIRILAPPSVPRQQLGAHTPSARCLVKIRTRGSTTTWNSATQTQQQCPTTHACTPSRTRCCPSRAGTVPPVFVQVVRPLRRAAPRPASASGKISPQRPPPRTRNPSHESAGQAVAGARERGYTTFGVCTERTNATLLVARRSR